MSMHIQSFFENPLMFTQVIIQKQKRMDGQTYDRRHMDVQRETIIPHHYCVARYKKPATDAADGIFNYVLLLFFRKKKA